jgi:hypothetical protein
MNATENNMNSNIDNLIKTILLVASWERYNAAERESSQGNSKRKLLATEDAYVAFRTAKTLVHGSK